MITLNQEQERALETLQEFVLSPKKQQIILNGVAGSGKTLLISLFLDWMKEVKNNIKLFDAVSDMSVEVVATTHKAAGVLQDKVQGNRVRTLHSYLGVKIGGEREVFPPLGNRFTNSMLIIIDEASYISKPMLNFLGKLVTSNSKCKIIYIGDPWQLCVKYEHPPVFLAGIEEVKLNKRMRSSKQALNYFTDYLLTCAMNKSIPHLDSWKYSDDVLRLPECTEELYRNLGENDKILSYTKKKVYEHSLNTRKAKKLPLTPRVGEILELVLYNKEELIEIEEIQGSMDEYTSYCTFNALPKYDEHAAFLRHKQISLNKVLEDDEQVLNYNFLYAQTIHKSQGSTYDEVIIDLSSFRSSHSLTQYNKMLYVAATRARNKIILIGTPPNKFR